MSDDKSSLPASWRVAYGAGGKTVDIDPEQKPRNNDKLESQDVIGPYTDNYDTSDTLFTDHNQGREFEREGGRVFDAPIAQLSLRTDNPIFEDQVERYVIEPNLDPIEVHQALVEEDDDITFVDGHTPEVGEVYWVINDGHHRALAAFRRGDTTIPARRIDVLSKDELRAYGNPNYLPVEEDDDRIAAVENLHSLDEGVGPKELSLPEEWSKAYVNTPTDDGTTGIHLGQARQRGYKVMAVSEDGAALVSMADARQRFPMKLGPMSMPGKGIFMSPNKQFVLEYYSGHNDREALLTFEFDPSDVVSGNLTDREPEISVSKADLIEIEPLGEVHTARVAAAGLLDMLEGVRSQLAAAAQHVYDAWQPNDEEGDDEYGFGGICDAVARAMSEVLSALPVSLIDGGQDGDDHAWIIAYTESEAMGIDIPPSVYETGGGYSWTKIPDVTIQPDDVVFFPIKRSDIDVDDEFNRSAGRLWYHGDLSQRLGFADQRMQNEANWNAMGPGIYFTSDKQQALGYAGASGYVYTAEVSGKFATDEQKPTVKEIRKFLSMLDDEGRSYLFSNWDENPQRAQRIVEATYTSMDFVSAFADLGRQGGTDYGETGQQWTAMMVKLGYAGMLHKLPSVEHLIVWDPNAITVKSEEAAVDLRATKEAAALEAPPAVVRATEAVVEHAVRFFAYREAQETLALRREIPAQIEVAEAALPELASQVRDLKDGDPSVYVSWT